MKFQFLINILLLFLYRLKLLKTLLIFLSTDFQQKKPVFSRLFIKMLKNIAGNQQLKNI